MHKKYHPSGQGIISFVKDIIRWDLSGGISYQLYLCGLVLIMMFGVYAYFLQFNLGLSLTNMSDIVSWGFYIVYSHYHNRLPDKKKYVPFVFLSIVWAFAIHMVTAFLYEGLPARAFWNNPLMGPRFLASAFAAGPALISVVLGIIHSVTAFRIESRVFGKLRLIIIISAIINLVMLFSEIFKEFYTPTHHSQSAIYLFFGLNGYDALVPWIWTGISMNIIGTIILMINPGRNNPLLNLPAAILLFLGIWIEKGMGLIVPGLVPSPLGEIVNYAPSWIEISISLGILSFGIMVVTLLLKPALIIEQGFEQQTGAADYP
ncbi:MAG: NrfD/PsrC family molybdoenzyme membrane anchor subunit [Pseudomonadota bacterium]